MKKVVRDLWLTRGRTVLTVVALSLSLASLGAILMAEGVLTKEMNRNYLDSIPAHSTLEIETVSSEVLSMVRDYPEIESADRRRTIQVRTRRDHGANWGRSLLFVADNYSTMPLAKQGFERGAQEPGLGEILVERSALRILRVDVGDSLWVKIPSGVARQLVVVGVVHEPALAPATTEQSGYIYVTAETAIWLGVGNPFDELRVRFIGTPDQHRIEVKSQALATRLSGSGATIHEIRIPPVGKHPHQGPMSAVMTMLSIFGILMVVLGGFLTAALINSIMARQIREIGVMKTMGASRLKIGTMYGTMTTAIALASLLLSIVPAWAIGSFFITAVADLINFDITSRAVPLWSIIAQLVAGLGVPLVIVLPAIFRASRISVHEAISDFGVVKISNDRFGKNRWLVHLNRTRPMFQFAALNALRQRRRFLLTTGLLAVGGGMFISSLSISNAWETVTGSVLETRNYDLEVWVSANDSATPIIEFLEALPETKTIEIWGYAPALVTGQARFAISHMYPDEGHGSFSMLAPPPSSTLVNFPLLTGRWLRSDDVQKVVLNQGALGMLGLSSDPVGRIVNLTVGGRQGAWEVVGIVEEIASAAAAYVSHNSFHQLEGVADQRTMLRITLASGRDPVAMRNASRKIEQILNVNGAGVELLMPVTMLMNAMGEHVELLIQVLLVLSMLMAVVGILGLGSTMATSIIERKRELGILKAIGATGQQVRQVFFLEAVVVGLVSLPVAVLLAVPMAKMIGDLIGQLSFGIGLPLDLSWFAVGAWTLGTIVLVPLTALLSVQGAIRLTVQEALSSV